MHGIKAIVGYSFIRVKALWIIVGGKSFSPSLKAIEFRNHKIKFTIHLYKIRYGV